MAQEGPPSPRECLPSGKCPRQRPRRRPGPAALLPGVAPHALVGAAACRVASRLFARALAARGPRRRPSPGSRPGPSPAPPPTYGHGDVPGHVHVGLEAVHPHLSRPQSVALGVVVNVVVVGFPGALDVRHTGARQDLHAAATLPHLRGSPRGARRSCWATRTRTPSPPGALPPTVRRRLGHLRARAQAGGRGAPELAVWPTGCWGLGHVPFPPPSAPGEAWASPGLPPGVTDAWLGAGWGWLWGWETHMFAGSLGAPARGTQVSTLGAQGGLGRPPARVRGRAASHLPAEASLPGPALLGQQPLRCYPPPPIETPKPAVSGSSRVRGPRLKPLPAHQPGRDCPQALCRPPHLLAPLLPRA